MLNVDITYFDISPEIEFDNRRGHLVKYAYRPQVDEDFATTEISRYFNFIEQSVFRLEWRRLVGKDFTLLKSREQEVYPPEYFSVRPGLVRRGEAFLDREFLTYQPGFVEAPKLFLRVSLIPILATVRQDVGYDRHGAYYMLIPGSTGNQSEFNSGVAGYPF
jgi:hypothetical protein